MKKDISLIEKVIERNPDYPLGLTYPFYTHKGPRGNCAGLVWVCEDCGYTSFFSYRNDMMCASGIYYCKRCDTSQCLTAYYNGEYIPLKCVAGCNQSDELQEWDGKICPKCGGKIAQFNAASLLSPYVNYYYHQVDKNVTIFDTIEEKGLPE